MGTEAASWVGRPRGALAGWEQLHSKAKPLCLKTGVELSIVDGMYGAKDECVAEPDTPGM